jgi:hypothetical protein
MGLLITAFLVLAAVLVLGIMASEYRWLRIVLGCGLLVFAGCAFYLSSYVLNHHSSEANASGLGAVVFIACAVGVISVLVSIVMFAWASRGEG